MVYCRSRSSFPCRLPVERFGMDSPLDGRSSLNTCANGKAMLTTSRRSFIAGWKLCAGVALGLGLAGRSSLAQNNQGGGGNNNNQGGGGKVTIRVVVGAVSSQVRE